MEEMDSVFQPGSVNKMISNRLRYGDVNWQSATKAAAKVMPPGGKVEMNVWTASQQEVDALTQAFEKAGFKNVSVGLRVHSKVVPGTTMGPGTILQAER
jgi:hypothetical protein